MVRRAAHILDVAKQQSSRLKAKAFALAPWAFDEADREPAKPLPTAEHRDSGQP